MIRGFLFLNEREAASHLTLVDISVEYDIRCSPIQHRNAATSQKLEHTDLGGTGISQRIVLYPSLIIPGNLRRRGSPVIMMVLNLKSS